MSPQGGYSLVEETGPHWTNTQSLQVKQAWERGGPDPVSKVQGAFLLGFLKQCLSWRMIKGPGGTNRPEELSRETWRRNADAWKVANVAAVHRPKRSLLLGESWRRGLRAATAARGLLSMPQTGTGWRAGTGPGLNPAAAGRPGGRNSQQQETSQSGGCGSLDRSRWRRGGVRVRCGHDGVSDRAMTARAWILWILSHTPWGRGSFSRFTDGNAQARRHLSKVQVGSHRTRTWTYGYLASKPTTQGTCKKGKHTDRKKKYSMRNTVAKFQNLKASPPTSQRYQGWAPRMNRILGFPLLNKTDSLPTFYTHGRHTYFNIATWQVPHFTGMPLLHWADLEKKFIGSFIHLMENSL